MNCLVTLSGRLRLDNTYDAVVCLTLISAQGAPVSTTEPRVVRQGLISYEEAVGAASAWIQSHWMAELKKLYLV